MAPESPPRAPRLVRLGVAPSQLVLRLAILIWPVLAVGLTRIAAGHSLLAVDVGTRPLVGLDLLVIGVAVIGAMRPDSHAGLFLVAAIGTDWALAVDRSDHPLVIGVGVLVVLTHASMAAASVAPIGAAWGRGLARNWIGRSLAVAALTLPTWGLVRASGWIDPGGRTWLFVVALVGLAAAGTWAVGRSTDTPGANPSDPGRA